MRLKRTNKKRSQKMVKLTASQIIFVWEYYVEEDDSKLVPKAQELKRRYKEIFEKLET